MRAPRFVQILAIVLPLALGSVAHADEAAAQGFVQRQYQSIVDKMKDPHLSADARDAAVASDVDQMIDFDVLTHRAFGAPCPAAGTCKDHWADLNDAQHAEVSRLLRSLIQKNYKKNLAKTLDYDVTFLGARDVGGLSRIRTDAKSRTNTREPPVRVDYVVTSIDGKYRVIDIVTENSSMTKNYYDQFHKILTTDGQGYPYLVSKLNEKLRTP